MRLHFREYGRGVPLIILHGLFGSLENWQTISRRLAPHFHVLAVDQRNHGHSPHSGEMNYRLMVEDLCEFMHERSLASAHLLGHSMGGKTAMQFALFHPQKVEKLIVADVSPRAYPPAHEMIFDALLGLDVKSFPTRRQIEDALAPAIPEPAVRGFLLKNLARDPQGVFHWKIPLPDIFRNYVSLSAAVEANLPFEKPALFVRGAESAYVREQDAPAIQRLFPCAEIRTLPGAGHWVHADAPDDFVRAALFFLTG
jgi:esterase